MRKELLSSQFRQLHSAFPWNNHYTLMCSSSALCLLPTCHTDYLKSIYSRCNSNLLFLQGHSWVKQDFFFFLLVHGGEEYNDYKFSLVPWPPFVLRCQQFHHHCSCTIGTNVNIVKNTDSVLVLSWKQFCPKDPLTSLYSQCCYICYFTRFSQ